MSICYDLQKSTMIAFAIVPITMIVGLINLVGEANGQALTSTDEIQRILNYCYEHADRPNPVQDLLDKSLISSNFAGETCGSIKQAYDNMREEIENQTRDLEARLSEYEECRQNVTQDCQGILSYNEFRDHILLD